MYNAVTNGWKNFEHQITFDVRQPKTRRYTMERLRKFIAEHPYVNVIRYTTFFHQFTLVFDELQREKYVDWYGYSASVSPYILEQFEREAGYKFRPEFIIDQGYYNNQYRVPSKEFKDFQAFQRREVAKLAREMVDVTHELGKEAMMFLGDHWIGTEPYGEHFATTGLDAVVGSVGSGATCRMIADIPHVRYTEGRFLPYFFPDVFHPGGNPVSEANRSWLEARRAIVRSPLDRIGYGGYLSLAVEHPDFIDRVEQIVAEFRSIHERSAGLRPLTPGFKVAVINSWGRLRSWMTHMVAHALWYRQTYTYLGVLEALSGLPVDVEFLSFDDVRAGLAPDVKVLICAGAEGTAFSGGEQWADAELVAQVSSFVAAGGGLIGVGAPSAHPAHGVTFQLADVLGVDREIGWGLSTRRRPPEVEEHFITRDLTGGLDDGEGTPDIVVTSPATRVLDAANGQVRLAVHELGRGRAVYATGLPYSAQNSRLLHRAIFWAAGRQEEFSAWAALDPRVEVAAYPDGRTTLAINNSLEPVTTTVPTPQGPRTVRLEEGGYQWLTAAPPLLPADAGPFQ